MNNESKQNNGSKPKKKGSPGFFLLIIAIYFLSSLLPFARSMMRKINLQKMQPRIEKSETTSDSKYPYEDLEILSVDIRNLSETDEWKNGSLSAGIPELEGVAVDDGYQLYQFDVHLKNNGTRECIYEGSVYAGCDEGDVIQHIAPYKEGSKEMDTRFLPPGREAVVTVYASVADGTSPVYVKTYYTKSREPATYYVEME